MKHLLDLLVFLLLWVAVAAAQTAVVTRNVYLRSDASRGRDPIANLKPGPQIQLLEPDPTNDFLHVQTLNDEKGWIWSGNVRVLQDSETLGCARGQQTQSQLQPKEGTNKWVVNAGPEHKARFVPA